MRGVPQNSDDGDPAPLRHGISEERSMCQAAKSFSQWLDTALGNGANVARRWTTQTVAPAHPMEFRNSLTPQQSMRARTEEWNTLWNKDTQARDTQLQQMLSLKQEVLLTPAREWTAKSVRKRNRARGVVGFALQKYCACPKGAMADLASVMQAVESFLALPTQTCVNTVGLQGKSNASGERPITLTGCPDSIFMSGYQKAARFWHDAHHEWWDHAVNGSNALQRALQRRKYGKLPGLNGQPTVCLYFDLNFGTMSPDNKRELRCALSKVQAHSMCGVDCV